MQNTFGAQQQLKYAVVLEDDEIAGIPVRLIRPKIFPEHNKHKVLLNLHGGAFCLDSGSLTENIPIASLTQTLDNSGRVAAAGPAFAGIGSAVGPTIMAIAIPCLPGYQAIGWVTLFLLIIVGSGFLTLTLSIDRNHSNKGVIACP